MKTPRSKWIAIWVILVVVGTGSFLVEPYLVISTTASVKYRLFWLERGPGAKGDYVNFLQAHPQMKDGSTFRLSKRITCAEGEWLRYESKHHFCGDVDLGVVLDRDSKGKALLPFVWDSAVPSGFVFVSGDHERSFDSRYFGFVALRDTQKMRGIW